MLIADSRADPDFFLITLGNGMLHYASLLQRAGFDVATVPEERLCSASDKTLIALCAKERRCLITLDMDFANPLVFHPLQYAGIVVLRLPPKPIPADIKKEGPSFDLPIAMGVLATKDGAIER